MPDLSQEVMDTCISDTGKPVWVAYYSGDDVIELDGDFSSKELRAMADFMDKHASRSSESK